MQRSASRKHIVISSDCHAGPRKSADYRPYIDPSVRSEFDDYVEREERATRNLFGAEVGPAAGKGDEAFRSRRIAQLKALGLPDDIAELNVETHYRSEASNAGAWDSAARGPARGCATPSGRSRRPPGVAPTAWQPATLVHRPCS